MKTPLFFLILLTLISCKLKQSTTNDIPTQIEVHLQLPGDTLPNQIELQDTNYYNTYYVTYLNGYSQVISLPENYDPKEFLTYPVEKIDTIQKRALWKDLD